jgi:hypothetical protein
MLLRYRVSSTGIRLVYITIILIVAAIWYAGFYSYAKLHQYVESIKGDKDGKQIDKLSKGIFLLIMWLPLSSVISAILQYVVTKHPGALAAVTIIDNYINLLLPLGGFILIGMGARGLSELTRRRTTYRAANLLAVVLVYIGIIYYRLVASTPDRTAIYHMTIWFIALTLIAPYIYMWFTGLLATYEIYSYQKKVVGVVYRKSLRFLVLGLGWLIVTSISFQYLTSLSARLSRLSIYWLLVIIYSLLLVLSVGFVLIAIGTRKLQKIEEA